jgi:hypothetical protein
MSEVERLPLTLLTEVTGNPSATLARARVAAQDDGVGTFDCFAPLPMLDE